LEFALSFLAVASDE
jgi:hypothetical protein